MEKDWYQTLFEKRQHLLPFWVDKFFEKLISLPSDIRPDVKERTGVAALLREVNTRNIIYFLVKEPSQAAQFFVAEKAVRSQILGHTSSMNSQNPDEYKFAGSVTIKLKGIEYQASCSGLKSEEDVFFSIFMLSLLFRIQKGWIIKHIKENGGVMPDFESEEFKYLQGSLPY